MRTQSVDVLNDANAFERKASWIAFQEEISFVWDFTPLPEDLDELAEDPDYLPNRVLYGDHEWRPGVPLFNRPNPFLGEFQCIRHIIEAFWCHDEEEATQFGSQHWCRECQVGWKGSEKACWLCKQTDAVESHPYVPLNFNDIFINPRPVTPFQPTESRMEWLREGMRTHMDEELARVLWGRANPHVHSVLETPPHHGLRGMRWNGLTEVDEWAGSQADSDGTVDVTVGVPLGVGDDVVEFFYYNHDELPREFFTVKIPVDWQELTRPVVSVPEGPFRPVLAVNRSLNRRMDDRVELPIHRRRRTRG